MEEIACYLSSTEQVALRAIQQAISHQVDYEQLVLFGSVVRGEATPESDIDLLIVTSSPFNRLIRHRITDIVCEINMTHDTNFSTTVIDKQSWHYGLVSVSPFRKDIEQEGIVADRADGDYMPLVEFEANYVQTSIEQCHQFLRELKPHIKAIQQ